MPRRLEFSTGPTCSADWETADPFLRATTAVRIAWPHQRSPRIGALAEDGAITDMHALATADRDPIAD